MIRSTHLLARRMALKWIKLERKSAFLKSRLGVTKSSTNLTATSLRYRPMLKGSQVWWTLSAVQALHLRTLRSATSCTRTSELLRTSASPLFYQLSQEKTQTMQSQMVDWEGRVRPHLTTSCEDYPKIKASSTSIIDLNKLAVTKYPQSISKWSH